ncbi:MAG TPA: MBL fold metallo-hydrolase, partial [Bacillota bacterium]|nr:MBL fold metallo-hydrolase [Bacillota bacterium]
LRVIHTPGHCLGHCCLYVEERGLLFSGDHILPNIWPNPLLEEEHQGSRCRAYPAYLKSIEQISRLQVEQVFPGHGQPFSQISQVIQGFWAHHSKRQQRVLDCLTSKPQTPYQITSLLYPEAKELNLFLTLSKVWGHLDVLADRKRIRECCQHPVTYYKVFA